MRAVLDPNVLIAALLSPGGAPAQLIGSWLSGEFELVVSEALLAELERALAYPKLSKRISSDETTEFVTILRHGARLAADPPSPVPRSRDSGDDYLIALSEAERAILVSGDEHLIALGKNLPIRTPRAFLDELTNQ